VLSVADGLAELDARAPLGCDCWLVRVRTEVTTTTAGVCPATDGVGVMKMTDVWISVVGGNDDAVKTCVVVGCTGRFELAGGGAGDDCAGGGALEATGWGAEDAGGLGVGEFTGDCGGDGEGA
jgi:hypothetical protein